MQFKLEPWETQLFVFFLSGFGERNHHQNKKVTYGIGEDICEYIPDTG